MLRLIGGDALTRSWDEGPALALLHKQQRPASAVLALLHKQQRPASALLQIAGRILAMGQPRAAAGASS
jgi:hypothetical protein